MQNNAGYEIMICHLFLLYHFSDHLNRTGRLCKCIVNVLNGHRSMFFASNTIWSRQFYQKYSAWSRRPGQICSLFAFTNWNSCRICSSNVSINEFWSSFVRMSFFVLWFFPQLLYGCDQRFLTELYTRHHTKNWSSLVFVRPSTVSFWSAWVMLHVPHQRIPW